MSYGALYLLFQSGENNGCWDLSIDIRPSLGILLKASITLVGQYLETRARLALKLFEQTNF